MNMYMESVVSGSYQTGKFIAVRAIYWLQVFINGIIHPINGVKVLKTGKGPELSLVCEFLLVSSLVC